MQNFCLITTGGTIDSEWDAISDTVKPTSETQLGKYLDSLKLYSDFSIKEICHKDSRELDKEDLDNIIHYIEGSEQQNFLITHGTYTMPDTARYLQNKLEKNNIKIILTGAMKPLGFNFSDGGFNLGFAMAQFEHIPAGVYVAIHGRLFAHDEVTKTISEGRFTSIKD